MSPVFHPFSCILDTGTPSSVLRTCLIPPTNEMHECRGSAEGYAGSVCTSWDTSSPTVLLSSITRSTERCLYSTLKLSIRGWRSTICREDTLAGQKAGVVDNWGEEEEEEEEGGGAALPAAASAASDWFRRPYMPAWLASLGEGWDRSDKVRMVIITKQDRTGWPTLMDICDPTFLLFIL